MVLRVADLTLDPVSHHVVRGGRAIHLTRTEYALLAVLMRHAGEVVSRSRLTQSVRTGDVDSLCSALAPGRGDRRRRVPEGARVAYALDEVYHPCRGKT